MANEVSHRYSATGSTLYFTIRNTNRQYWNTAGTPNFETLTVANWGDYNVALSESPASSYFYVGTFPPISGNMVAGWYWVDIYLRAGGSPAISDVMQASYFGYWSGTTFKFWGDDVIQVGGTTQTAGDISARLPAALTSNGNMKSSLLEIISTTFNETSTGLISAAFKKFFDKSSPTGTINSLPDAVAGATGGLSIVGSAMTLSAAALQAIWDVATSGLTTAGSIGKYLLDHIVGTLASGTHNAQTGDSYARLGAPAGASISADIAAAKTDTGNLVTRVGTPSDLGSGATVAGNLVDIEAQTDDIGAAGAGLSAIPKTGYKLASDGLDAVLIESSISAGADLTNDSGTQLTSINARQAMALFASALEGVLAGAATTTITIKPAGKPSGNTRVTATVDSSGNRSALTLKVPD